MRQAAIETGVARQTISRWLKAKKIKGKPTKVGRMPAMLVSVADVLRLREAETRGRPNLKGLSK